jgi:hypothetical protein
MIGGNQRSQCPTGFNPMLSEQKIGIPKNAKAMGLQ